MTKIEKAIVDEIEKIRDDEVQLYSYLYDLFYEEKCTNKVFLENLYASFLSDERDDIKRVSIRSLMFGLKIRKDDYKKIAIQIAKNLMANFDLRLTCLSSLAEAYIGLKEKEILLLFYNIYSSDVDDTDIRAQGFIGILKSLGLTSLEITRKNRNTVIVSFDDIYKDAFISELNETRRILAFNSGASD